MHAGNTPADYNILKKGLQKCAWKFDSGREKASY